MENDELIQLINHELLQVLEFYYCNIYDIEDVWLAFNEINKTYGITMLKKVFLKDGNKKYCLIGNVKKTNIYKLNIKLKDGDLFWK